MGIGVLDQLEFPRLLPLLEPLFHVDGVANVRVLFEPHKPTNAVTPRMPTTLAVAMLVNAAHEVVRHPDISRAAPPVCHDVNETAHGRLWQRGRGGRQDRNTISGRCKVADPRVEPEDDAVDEGETASKISKGWITKAATTF